MPHKRTRNLTGGPVPARLDGLDGYPPDVLALVRCGRCGAAIMEIEPRADEAGMSWSPLPLTADGRTPLFVLSTWGRTWDGRAWRVTADHNARRGGALRRASRGSNDSPHALRRNLFHRTSQEVDRRPQLPGVPSDGFRLPVLMECDRCGVENHVSLDT